MTEEDFEWLAGELAGESDVAPSNEGDIVQYTRALLLRFANENERPEVRRWLLKAAVSADPRGAISRCAFTHLSINEWLTWLYDGGPRPTGWTREPSKKPRTRAEHSEQACEDFPPQGE